MTIQEMIESFEGLSEEEQISLLNLLLLKRKRGKISAPDASLTMTEPENLPDENFWEMTLRFRELMQKEGIEFTDSDFADLRERSPGREVNFEL